MLLSCHPAAGSKACTGRHALASKVPYPEELVMVAVVKDEPAVEAAQVADAAPRTHTHGQSHGRSQSVSKQATS